ncbi:MAG: IclR family transcriptional regulator [Candidatus Limnocylindria bacterium]
MLGEKPKYPIESVDNALRLLLGFREHATLGVSDAGELIGVAPSTAHRLLSMLQYRGFAMQDDERRMYRAGPALIEIGLKAVRDLDLRQAARPHLEHLNAAVDETVHLLLLEGSGARFIDGVESSRALRVTSRTGMLLPAHCTAGGKALLAALSQEQLRALLPDERLIGLTAKSVVTRAQLEAELAEVAQRGYATNTGESEDDVTAIGVAIRDQRGRARAAAAIAVPSSRMDAGRVEAYAAALIETAVTIGTTLD